MFPENEKEAFQKLFSEKSLGRHQETSRFLSAAEIGAIHTWIAEMAQHKLLLHKLQACKKILQLQSPVIGNGMNRIVFDLQNGTVLKVALSEWGYRSNETEAQIYRDGADILKKHLCPVYESGHGWIIMQKMLRKVPMSLVHVRALVELEVKFLFNGILPVDLRLANAALSEQDEIVVIDYGMFIKGFDSPYFKKKG